MFSVTLPPSRETERERESSANFREEKKNFLESKTESENMNLLSKLDFLWQTHTNDTLSLSLYSRPPDTTRTNSEV